MNFYSKFRNAEIAEGTSITVRDKQDGRLYEELSNRDGGVTEDEEA